MKIDVIIYKSQTGHTKRYAHMLSDATGIPAYSTHEAITKVRRDEAVLFMGWIRMRDVIGYNLLMKLYDVEAICAVGAADSGFSDIILEKIKKRYHIAEEIPLFYLQGGFTPRAARGTDRRIVGALVDKLGKKIRRNRKKGISTTGYEENLLHVLVNGGDFVSMQNLEELKGMCISE